MIEVFACSLAPGLALAVVYGWVLSTVRYPVQVKPPH